VYPLILLLYFRDYHTQAITGPQQFPQRRVSEVFTLDVSQGETEHLDLVIEEMCCAVRVKAMQ